MKLNQYAFSSDDRLIEEIDKIKDREARKSRSEMIVILLRMAVKEKNRKRKNAKEVHI